MAANGRNPRLQGRRNLDRAARRSEGSAESDAQPGRGGKVFEDGQLVRVLAVAVCTCCLSACWASADPPSATSRGVTVPESASLSSASPGVPEAVDGPGGEARVRTPLPEPTADADRSDATVLAVRAMQLYARRDVSAQRWLDELSPLMTQQGAQDLVGTDPINVPPTKVSGPGRSVPMQTDRLATILVPTDAGTYQVLLSRTPEQPQWLVERITSPQGQG